MTPRSYGAIVMPQMFSICFFPFYAGLPTEMGMAVNSLQITAKTASRGSGRPFVKGQSGNPAGRPKGAKNRKTLMAELLLEGEADNLARKAVELALAGNEAALRLCLDRLIAPRRERSVRFTLPPLESAGDIAAVMIAVTEAVADGTLSPGEALALSQTVDTFLRAIDTRDFEARLKRLEESDATPLSRGATDP
jgi:hypothetical protein